MKLTRQTFSNIHDVLQRMECLVGHHSALIREVFPVAQAAPFDIFHYYNATIGDTRRLGQEVQWSLAPSYAGSAWTREESIAAAIGEAVERYACGVYDANSLVVAAYREVAEQAIPLEHLVLFTPQQYEEGPVFPTPDTRLRWVEGYSLAQQKLVLVPAAMVFIPYRNSPNEDPIIWEATSSGAACGGSLEEAILCALCEVIERDAIMITWLNQLPVPCIPLEEIDHPPVAYALQRLANTSYRLLLNDITTDIPLPVFLATLINERDAPPYSVIASACGLDKCRAALKSITEVLHGLKATQTLLERHPDFAADTLMRTLEDHTLLYAKFDLRERLAFFTNSSTVRHWSSVPHLASGQVASDIDKCVHLLKERNYDVIVVDLTPPEIAECGLFVVRVVVPGMTPLHGKDTLCPLGVKRVRQVPIALGYGVRDLNPFPHPFP